MPRLPSGVVTFLFSDIEGSTRLLQRLGDDYANVLEDHCTLLREAFVAHDGVEVALGGDSFFVAFERAEDGVAAALAGQRALGAHDWGSAGEVRVRMGLHTGEALVRGSNYVGMAVHIAARIMGAAHGGQVVMSDVTQALAEQRLVAPVDVRDLGHHQLKDLPAPHRIFQISAPGLDSAFPPLRSIDTPRHALPVDLTSFVGRHTERAELAGMLDRSRLTTVVGPGGSGKTRLAVEVARDQCTERDLTWFVDLVPVRDADAVLDAIRAAMPGDEGGEPAGGGALEAVTSRLADRSALLVLDNCEHVIGASADAVRTLLAGCPSLTVLATSRAPLGIGGERTWRLPALAADDAVALFSDRGDLARPGYRLDLRDHALVQDLCAQLDGNPLALELAAARLAVLTPTQIKDRLDDRFALLASRDAPERHRTLTAVIDWSYELLSDDARALLRALSVFRDGFEVEAVEAIGGGRTSLERLDLLALLVDQSLVQTEVFPTGARFSLLETIREYAARLLADSGEQAEVEERLVDWCVDLAQRADHAYQTSKEGDLFATIVRERGNLRAGFEAAMAVGRVDDAGRVAAGACRALVRAGTADGWRDLLLSALAAMPPDADARATVLGHLTVVDGLASPEAGTYLEEAIALCRANGDRRGLARWLHASGGYAAIHGNVLDDPGVPRAEKESSEIFLELGEEAAAAWSIGSIADHMMAQGMFVEALALYERAAALVADGAAPSVEAGVGESRARLARYLGDLDAAEREATHALRIALEIGDEWNGALCIDTLGWVAMERGEVEEAGIFLRDALSRTWAFGRSADLAEPLESLAHHAVVAGDFERAAVILGAAGAMVERDGLYRFPVAEATVAADHDAIVAALGPDAATSITKRGAAMSEREVVEVALGAR